MSDCLAGVRPSSNPSTVKRKKETLQDEGTGKGLNGEMAQPHLWSMVGKGWGK
jgi:hypothetical protein